MTARRALQALVVIAALALAPAGAVAGQRAALKAVVSSSGDITLGDLFDNAGPAAPVVIGNGAPPGQSAVLDADVVQRLAADHGVDWDNPDGIRRIVVPSTGDRPGPATPMTEVLAYARNLAAGETLQPEDLTYAAAATFALPADPPRDAQSVIGKVTRRPLRAGAAVAIHDVAAPEVIRRDDLVEVTYRADGIELVLQGKALGSAAAGEPVEIDNAASKKSIQAIATGPDQAVVGPEAEEIKAALIEAPTQFAALR